MHVQGLVHAYLQRMLHVMAWIPRQRNALATSHIPVWCTDHVHLDSYLCTIPAWMSCTMCVDVHGSAARKKRTLGGCLECAIVDEILMDGSDRVRCDDHDTGIHFGRYELDIIGHFEL